jgi:hypothetical protein
MSKSYNTYMVIYPKEENKSSKGDEKRVWKRHNLTQVSQWEVMS